MHTLIHIRIAHEDLEQLRIIAERQDATVTALVKRAVKILIAQKREEYPELLANHGTGAE